MCAFVTMYHKLFTCASELKSADKQSAIQMLNAQLMKIPFLNSLQRKL